MSDLNANQPLSPAQERIYNRLVEHQRRTGVAPELSEFARGLGIHYVTLRQHLEALQQKGYLLFESRGRGRSPRVELRPEATGVPLLGAIPAGALSIAAASADGYLAPLPGQPSGQQADFALRVDGYSMADLIQPGDIVLMAQCQPSRSGEICAVRVEDDEVTLKYVDRSAPGRYLLRPHNPDYATVEVAAADLAIDGVYRGLLRGSAAEGLLLTN